MILVYEGAAAPRLFPMILAFTIREDAAFVGAGGEVVLTNFQGNVVVLFVIELGDQVALLVVSHIVFAANGDVHRQVVVVGSIGEGGRLQRRGLRFRSYRSCGNGAFLRSGIVRERKIHGVLWIQLDFLFLFVWREGDGAVQRRFAGFQIRPRNIGSCETVNGFFADEADGRFAILHGVPIRIERNLGEHGFLVIGDDDRK